MAEFERARTVCAQPGCPELVPCPRHPRRTPWSPPTSSRNHRGVSRHARGHGAEFDRLKPLVLERDGYLCRIGLPGCTRRATTADYIVPWSAGGQTVMENLQGACLHCNSAKQARPIVRRVA